MVRGLIDAWGMEPLGTLRLGGREFPVPPLTLGRFQRVLGLDTMALAGALVEEYKRTPPWGVRFFRAALRFVIIRGLPGRRLLWWLVETFHVGRGLYPAKPAAEAIAIAVPGVSPELWREHGSQAAFSRLFLLFANGHDWPYIADAIRFGEPLEEGEVLPSPDDITAGLLAVARETGHTIEQLSTMRLEGFYRMTAAIRAKNEAQASEVQQQATPGGPLPGVEYVSASEIPSSLTDLLDRATGDPNA